ncbi:winged helix-turn-helix domain-containing protein [Actinocatenispora rupis]|uniref:Transcriptional regulator n=1 Tax=Actinocatenispora rupis TaxID=519421 RepID=A0A8J3J3P0_9ACTN|nr:winged helix-turn-helix domain-containing protein [Actinocatenispora rupis]GID15236.1 transcriptional regulator [Actinocatenispora rupis]
MAEDESGDRGGALPHRYLRDPRELRAIAHPLRVRILEELFLDGALTASQLSERVGESPANCSWHLRQLQKYGYVEEAGGGTGRQRPWKPVLEQRSWGERAEGEVAAARETMADQTYQREFDEHTAYQRRKESEPQDWYDAAFFDQSFLWVTPEELRELSDEIVALITRRVRGGERFTDPSTRPDGARPVRFVAWGIPARPWSEDRP